MKIISSAIYKLMAQADCGCAAVGEFSDSAYKLQVGTTSFHPCATHKDHPGLDMFTQILKEVVAKEAREMKPPPVAPPLHSQSSETTAPPRATLRTVAAENAAAAQPASGQPVTNGNETRRPIPGQRHRPPAQPGGTPRVIGGGGGVRRIDPAAAASARVGLKVASPGAGGGGAASLDIDEADEDSRVTNILENSGILDVGEEDLSQDRGF